MLILAGIVLLVTALVMIWPFSSRSRWDPSGCVRASSCRYLSLLTKKIPALLRHWGFKRPRPCSGHHSDKERCGCVHRRKE